MVREDTEELRRGGAVSTYQCDSLRVSDLVLQDNMAYWGAGIYNYYSSPVFSNIIFANNICTAFGAGMYNFESSPIINNCLFYNNYAGIGGAGIRNWSYSIPTVHHSTFYKNRAVTRGGVFYNSNHSDLSVYNCILWGTVVDDTTNQHLLDQFTTGTSSFEFVSCITEVDSGANVFVGQYPVFRDTSDLLGSDSTWATNDDGLDILYHSPALNSGDTAWTIPGFDIRGVDRIINQQSDIGAYEFNYEFPCGQYTSLTIDDVPIYTAEYKADGPINSSGLVGPSSQGNVSLQSGSEVLLESEFQVEVGHIFEAKVENPCVD